MVIVFVWEAARGVPVEGPICALADAPVQHIGSRVSFAGCHNGLSELHKPHVRAPAVCLQKHRQGSWLTVKPLQAY